MYGSGRLLVVRHWDAFYYTDLMTNGYMTKMTDTHPNLCATELPLEVARERVDPDAFDWLIVAMQNSKIGMS
jgi:hypothetical protein